MPRRKGSPHPTRIANAKEPARPRLAVEQTMFACSDNPMDPTFSSTIAGASFDQEEGIMMVAFRKKDKPNEAYFYNGSLIEGQPLPSTKQKFPETIWLAFLAAGSKGSFFQANIARRFKGVKVE